MNLVELLLFAGIIASGYFSGKWLGSHYGIAGWIVGFVLGIGAGLLFWAALGLLAWLWDKWRPPLPKCKNGKCDFDDYKFCKCSQDGVIKKCRCGTKYFLKEHRFMEILDDDSTKPYMKRKGFLSRWELES